MRLKNHLLAILSSLLILVLPTLFGLTSNETQFSLFWAVLTYIGILTSPGLAIALFFRRWVKNISDDMAFSLTLLLSIVWFTFLYTWQAAQGLSISHYDLLLSAVWTSIAFTILGSLPSGKTITASEPLKNKIPMFISIFLIIPSGVILIDSNTFSPDVDKTYVSITIDTGEGSDAYLEVHNPSENAARLSVSFVDSKINAELFSFTDVVAPGNTPIQINLPSSLENSCQSYTAKYSLINDTVSFESDELPILLGNCFKDDTIPNALPTKREELLNYIFWEGQK